MFDIYYWITRLSLVSPFSYNETCVNIRFSRQIAIANICLFSFTEMLYFSVYYWTHYKSPGNDHTFRNQIMILTVSSIEYMSGIMAIVAIVTSIRHSRCTQLIISNFNQVLNVIKSLKCKTDFRQQLRKFTIFVIIDMLVSGLCSYLISLSSMGPHHLKLWQITLLFPIVISHQLVSQMTTFVLYFFLLSVSRMFTVLNRCLARSRQENGEKLSKVIECYTFLDRNVRILSQMYGMFTVVLFLFTICSFLSQLFLLFMVSVRCIVNHEHLHRVSVFSTFIWSNIRMFEVMIVLGECDAIQLKVFIVHSVLNNILL